MNRIHLERIEVRELYGRRFELKLNELSSRVTVVYGPNASGKTALARAASQIFSAADRDRSARIYGLVSVDKQPYDVKLEGRNEPPSWPQSSRVDLYRLSIADLLNGPHDEDKRQIKQALAGGLNLREMEGIKAGRAPSKEVHSAIEEVRRKRQSAEGLRTQESELDAKHEQVAAAARAEQDLPFVTRWIEAAERERDAGAKQTEINDLDKKHPGIERQTENAAADIESARAADQKAQDQLRDAFQGLHAFGNLRAQKVLQASDRAQLSRLSSTTEMLAGKLDQAKGNARQADSRVSDARRALAVLKPDGRRAPGALDPVDAQNLADLVKSVGEATRKCNDAAALLGASEASLKDKRTAYTNAGGDAGPYPSSAPTIDQTGEVLALDGRCAEASVALQRNRDSMQEAQQKLDAARSGLAVARAPAREVLDQFQRPPGIAAVMDSVRSVQVKRDAFTSAAQQLRDSVEQNRPAAAAAAEAVESLRDWLRSLPEAATPAKPISVILLAIGLAVAGLVLGLAVNAIAGSVIGAVGLLIVAVVLFVRAPAVGGAGTGRPSVASRVPQAWQPTDWTVESVATQLAAALDKVREVAVVEQCARDFATRASGIDDQKVSEDLRQRMEAFSAATGIALGGGYDLADFVHRLSKLVDSEMAFDVAEKALTAAQEAFDGLRESRRSLIRKMGAPSETGAAAKAWADALRELIKAGDANMAVADANTTAARELLIARNALKEFFARFEWPVDGDPQVAKQGLEEWFERTQRLIDAETALAGATTQEQALQSEMGRTSQEIRALLAAYGFSCGDNPLDCVQPFLDWFEKTSALNRAESAAEDSSGKLLNVLDTNGIPNNLPIAERITVPAARQESFILRRKLDNERKDLIAQAAGHRKIPGWEEVFERLRLGVQPNADELKEKCTALAATKAQADKLKTEIASTETRLEEAARADNLAGAEKGLGKAVSQLDAWLTRKVDELAVGFVTERIEEAFRDEAQPDVIKWANEWLDRLTDKRYRGLDAGDATVSVIDTLEEGKRKELEELSTGTRAHLALAVRLAVIEASEKAGVRFPLFLDEVMAASDPRATQAIAEALGKIAEQRQVLVLTNQPDDVNVLREVLGDELAVQCLARATPPVYAPPAAAPAGKPLEPPTGIPIGSSIDQWRPAELSALAPELDAEAPTVYEACLRLDMGRRMEMEMTLAALEAVRARAAKAHRRLQWGDIEKEAWVTRAFRDRAQEALEKCKGGPKAFLDLFKQLDRMRDDTKLDCEGWLSDHGYLVDRPSLRELTDIALGKLPADYPSRQLVAPGLAAFFAAYT